MTLCFSDLAECVHERDVERRGEHGVELFLDPGIVFHLDVSVWCVGCLCVFVVPRLDKAY